MNQIKFYNLPPVYSPVEPTGPAKGKRRSLPAAFFTKIALEDADPTGKNYPTPVAKCHYCGVHYPMYFMRLIQLAWRSQDWVCAPCKKAHKIDSSQIVR